MISGTPGGPPFLPPGGGPPSASPGDVEEVTPTLRGVLHAYAFWFALAAGVVLIALAETPEARLAAAIYGAGMCALFAVSGLYHRWRWNPRWRPLVRRLDHSTIYVFIAASITPLALLVLTGPVQIAVLLLAWIGALAGIAMSAAWIDAPRGLVALSYVVVGCAAMTGLPQTASRLALTPLLLLGLGGVIYIVGAVVYALRRPDPWPRTFGFHEIFHSLVIVAAACHFVAMLVWILPSG